jgi:hypothetical protein
VFLVSFVPMVAPAQSPTAQMVTQVPQTPTPRTSTTTTVTAQGLLDAFRANQQRQAKFILNYEIQLDQDWQIRDPVYARLAGKHTRHHSGELRVDGTRHFQRDNEWTESTNRNVAKSKDKPMERMWLWDGRVHYFAGKGGDVQVSSHYTNHSGFAVNAPGHEGRGYLTDVHVRPFDAIMRGEKRLWLHPMTELVKGVPCYVIESVGTYGHFTVWLDPSHGCNLARAEMHMREGDTYECSNTLLHEGETVGFSMDDVRYQQIDGVWVLAEYACSVSKSSPARGLQRYTGHYKASNIRLNPEFEALRAFKPDGIEDGRKVFVAGPGNLGSYAVWQKGEVVDTQGKKVEF